MALEEEVKASLLEASRALGIRLERVLEIYLSFGRKARLLAVAEEGGRVAGVRIAVQSDSDPGLWYYTAVGPYGAKCTCRGNVVGGRICKHIVLALITWQMVSILKTGRRVDLSQLPWLRRQTYKEEAEEEALMRG